MTQRDRTVPRQYQKVSLSYSLLLSQTLSLSYYLTLSCSLSVSLSFQRLSHVSLHSVLIKSVFPTFVFSSRFFVASSQCTCRPVSRHHHLDFLVNLTQLLLVKCVFVLSPFSWCFSSLSLSPSHTLSPSLAHTHSLSLALSPIEHTVRIRDSHEEAKERT